MRASVGLPGTGLYWVETIKPGQGSAGGASARTAGAAEPAASGSTGSSWRRAIWVVLAITAAVAVLLALAGTH